MASVVPLSTVLAHKCDAAGCHSVLVLDGNMKNCRSVCKAEDAGYVNYLGLPGEHEVTLGSLLSRDIANCVSKCTMR